MQPCLVLYRGFPTGQGIATFREKWTEVPSLSWDTTTIGQAQNIAKGQDRHRQLVKIADRMQDVFLRKENRIYEKIEF